jgi:starvation-inducible outer membrane lipoprotein
MRNRNTLRITGTTLFWTAGILMLSACQPVPPPVPGQPLTWAQQHQLQVQEAQEMHDRRRQDRPCAPHDCGNY